MPMRNSLLTLVLLFLLGAALIASDSERSKAIRPQIAPVTCRFQVACEEGRHAASDFQIRGTSRHPEYVVQFDSWDGSAFLERHEQDWPETFDLKISGQRDAILCVSLIPEGYGEMHLLALSRKKEATYFNARGECLDDKPAADAFRIETADTPTGVAVTVTLPPGARLVRRLEVKYYSTWW